MRHLSHKILTILVLGFTTNSAFAENHIEQNAEKVFLPENAILDTSIPFAIGAREAQQELRGSYGWDTFQEGLVEGVYFRFDPDGYARFSPNPRLDSDLFEVICRPRTLNCLARKSGLSIFVNGHGELQLEMEGIAAGDQYFVADTLSEFELPDRIWQPLDARYENVLSVGGELIVRRGQNEVERVSLTGFLAVTSYLRWILAEQDYLALPRNWPVPNSGSRRSTGSLTTTQEWRSSVSPPETALAAVVGQPSEEVLEDNDELASLRALVEQMATQQKENSEIEMQSAALPEIATELPVASSQMFSELEFQLAKSLAIMEDIEKRLQILETENSPSPLETGHETDQLMSTHGVPDDDSMNTGSALIEMAEKVDVLTKEYGIEPQIAMLLLRLKDQNESAAGEHSVNFNDIENLLNANSSLEFDASILSSLSETSDESDANESDNEGQPQNSFVLLTDYFRSVTTN